MYKEEVNKIEKLIANYFMGIFTGDIVKVESCFHENTCIYGDIKNVTYLKSVHEYLEDIKNRQSPKDVNEEFKMKIIGIDVMGKIAMAKLHVPILGYNYYDYVSLAKINGDWKIINKTFTHVS